MDNYDIQNTYVFSKEIDILLVQLAQANFSCDIIDIRPDYALAESIKSKLEKLAPELDFDSNNDPRIIEAIELCNQKIASFHERLRKKCDHRCSKLR